MFSHVTVGTRNLEVSIDFYDAVLMPLGLIRRRVNPDGGPSCACWVKTGKTLPRFYIYEPFNGEPAHAGNGSMVAFEGVSQEEVNNSYRAGLTSGGISGGAPGPRDRYGKGYYGAYLYDPDGNKVHIVHRGDFKF